MFHLCRRCPPVASKVKSFRHTSTSKYKRRQTHRGAMDLSWAHIHERKAKIANDLFTFSTTVEMVSESGVDFVVRVARSLAQKPKGALASSSAPPIDPFENPPSQKLYAGSITPTHSFVFNKFNLVEDHMVIVTNDFESQHEALTLNDMAAVWKCIVELGGLGFFNGGHIAGASQPHKHLQFLPIPLVPESPFSLPIESTLLSPAALDGAEPLLPFVNPGLPFYNLFVLLPDGIVGESATREIHRLYVDMLAMAAPVYKKHNIPSPFCYNFLLMKRYMLIVPRSAECVEGTTISINSMGFTGSLFVKSLEHLDAIRKVGPMGALKSITLPSSESPAIL